MDHPSQEALDEIRARRERVDVMFARIAPAIMDSSNGDVASLGRFIFVHAFFNMVTSRAEAEQGLGAFVADFRKLIDGMFPETIQ